MSNCKCATSHGYVLPGNGTFFGHAENLEVSTTALSIPMYGIGLLATGNVYDVQITGRGNSGYPQLAVFNLESAIGVNLSVVFKNITTGSVLANLTLTAGSQSVSGGTGLTTVNSGDVMMVIITAASGTVDLPNCQWYTT